MIYDIHKLRKPLQRNQRYGAKGIALILTVLLGVIAASIALVILHQALYGSQASTASSSGATAASASLSAARSGFEQALSADPLFFEKTTFLDPGDGVAELPRVCPGASTPVVAGTAWPVSCGGFIGGTANYAPTYGGASNLTEQTVVEITAPSPGQPFLIVTFLAYSSCVAGTTQPNLASSCSTEAGETVTYRYGDSGKFSVYSTNSINLNNLATCGLSSQCTSGGHTTNQTSLTGNIYSGGTLVLPGSDSVLLNSAQVEAEGGFVGNGNDTSSSYSVGSTQGCTTQPTIGVYRNIRCSEPVVLGAGQLAGSVSTSVLAGCMFAQQTSSAGSQTSLPTNITVAGQQYSSSLCVRMGANVVTSNGTEVTVPGSVNGYLVVPSSTGGTHTVDVYTDSSDVGASTGTLPTESGACSIRCASPGISAAKNHFGSLGSGTSWAKLGTFYLPATGVIATDADTVYGLCQASSSSACSAVAANAGGFTLIAGTPGTPRNLYIGGPTGTLTNPIGLVATNDVVFPTWGAVTDGSVETLNATIIGLGEASSASSLVSGPNTVGTTGPTGTAQLTIHGSVLGGVLDLSQVASYGAINVTSDTSVYQAPPAWLPGPLSAWSATGSVALPASAYASL